MRIEVEMDVDAVSEAARVLNELARLISWVSDPSQIDGHPLLDENGNPIGVVKIHLFTKEDTPR